MKKWIAFLKNKKMVEEGEVKWESIKDKIVYLMFHNNGQNIYLPPNAEKYEQSKTASADMSNGKIEIESRNITAFLRNNIVKVSINEKNNNITISVTEK